MHKKELVAANRELEQAKKVLIMVHGRGASAGDIIGLSQYLNVDDFAILAPQATNHTWYPYSFLAPQSANEPWLSSAIDLLRQIVHDLLQIGFYTKDIFFLGFSQGACLVLEFAARHAAGYGGIAAFTGGLIGETVNAANYKGQFGGMPVFIGSSDPDPHVPVERVMTSAGILESMGAVVTKKIYKDMGHTINKDEIAMANKLIFAIDKAHQ